MPLFVNMVHDALLKNVTGSSTATIETYNEPLPSTLYEHVRLCDEQLACVHALQLVVIVYILPQANSIDSYSAGDLFAVVVPLACTLFMAAVAYVIAEVCVDRG